MNFKILYFNTVNKTKVEEIKEIFKNYNSKIQFFNYDIVEVLSQNLNKVILEKASKAYELCKVPIIVEHGALCIDNLKGLPGALAKPFWDLLQDKICSWIPNGESRRAIAASAVCYCDGKNRYIFNGETVGTITKKARGKNGFQWDPIFTPNGSLKTYAEMNLEEKLKYSQAAKAYKEFMKKFPA